MATASKYAKTNVERSSRRKVPLCEARESEAIGITGG